MRKLSEIQEQYKYKHPCDDIYSYESFLEKNGLTNDTVTEEHQMWFAKYFGDKRYDTGMCLDCERYITLFGYITEMLKSMNVENLLKALNRDFAGKYGKIQLKPGFDLYKDRMPIDVYVPWDLFKSEWKKFQEKLNAYMWYEAKHLNNGRMNNRDEMPDVFEFKGKDYICLRLDPIQSEDVSNYVYKECKGILYHVPDQNKIGEIKKSGLRMKGSKNTYKFIQDRIYFVCADSEENLKDNLKQIFEDKLIENPNPTIIKINLKKHDYNIILYHDQEYDLKDFVYTYAYFPPKMLEFTTLKEIENED